jgi:hypothetical protein
MAASSGNGTGAAGKHGQQHAVVAEQRKPAAIGEVEPSVDRGQAPQEFFVFGPLKVFCGLLQQGRQSTFGSGAKRESALLGDDDSKVLEVVLGVFHRGVIVPHDHPCGSCHDKRHDEGAGQVRNQLCLRVWPAFHYALPVAPTSFDGKHVGAWFSAHHIVELLHL